MGNDDDQHPDHDRLAIDEVTTDQPVPQDAEWEFVVQHPVDRSQFGGLTTTIISAIADAEGVPPMEIKEPPLYEVLDTAALEAAFFTPGDKNRTHDEGVTTEFMYRGYRTVVRSDGWVLVYDRRDE